MTTIFFLALVLSLGYSIYLRKKLGLSPVPKFTGFPKSSEDEGA